MARNHRFTPLQIAGGVLTVLGALAAVVQLLDYIKSGKLNLVLASIVGAVAVVGVAAISAQRARPAAAWIGAFLAVIVVASSYSAVALYNSDYTSPPNKPTAEPTSVVGTALPSTSAGGDIFAPLIPRQPLRCPATVGTIVEMHDDFEDGRVDPCKWAVDQTVTSLYHEQSGIRVYEQEGLLVFDVDPPLETGDDVEIFARPTGKVIQEVSADLTLLSNSGTSGGSTGLIANLGNGGPIMALDGGPGDNNDAGYEIALCPSDRASYDECQHPDPCGSLDLQTGVAVRLRIVRTTSGIESYIGDTSCGHFPMAQEITSVNLNLYGDSGSSFRMAIDNFYMRYVSA